VNVIPHDNKAELSLVGAVLINPASYAEVSSTVSSSDFYVDSCRAVWRAYERLAKKGLEIDAITVHAELPDSVSRTIISEAMSAVPFGSSTVSHARIVADLAVYRRMIDVSHELAKLAYSRPESSDIAIDEAQSKLFALTSKRAAKLSVPSQQVAMDVVKRLDKLMNLGEDPGIKTGIQGLDDITGGLQNSDLIILAARPSVGKTALAISAARHAAGALNKRVAIYSLEMSAQSVGTRLLASMSGVAVQDILRGRIGSNQWVKLAAGVARMMRAPVVIDDSPTITPADLRSRARYLKANGGLDLVIVDYLQLMMSDRQTKDANRVIEVSEISRSLKTLARELDVPVLALSQLNRSSEHREDGEPRLSDLRDSGAIEQDADIVLMLWRPAIFQVKMKVAKHRNGPTGEVDLEWRKETVEFR
jgi:replicative DNA helicase